MDGRWVLAFRALAPAFSHSRFVICLAFKVRQLFGQCPPDCSCDDAFHLWPDLLRYRREVCNDSFGAVFGTHLIAPTVLLNSCAWQFLFHGYNRTASAAFCGQTGSETYFPMQNFEAVTVFATRERWQDYAVNALHTVSKLAKELGIEKHLHLWPDKSRQSLVQRMPNADKYLKRLQHSWWLSKSPQPKADNRKVLTEYSQDMKRLLKRGYRPKERPSGHRITHKFTEQAGAIPPNLLTLGNNDSNGYYLKRCAEEKIKPHPARFPVQLPEFFIKFLTDERDMILDPFAGSCTTGEAAERLRRKWMGFELRSDYLDGAHFRFEKGALALEESQSAVIPKNGHAQQKEMALF